jgi:hypothetical protein
VPGLQGHADREALGNEASPAAFPSAECRAFVDATVDVAAVQIKRAVEVGGTVTNSGSITMKTSSAAPISDMTLELGPGQTFTNNATGVVNLDGPAGVGGAQMIESKNIIDGNVLNHGQMNIRTNAQIAGSMDVAVDADVVIDSLEPCRGMVLDVSGGVTNSGEFTLMVDEAEPCCNLTVELGAGQTFTNNAGAVLQGTGTINGNLLNRGQVRPGNSTGVLAVSGDYTQENDGTLVVEIGGTTAGSQHDQLAIGGDIALGGLVEV